MRTILFVLHEATRTGAPFTQLYLMRWLKQHTNFDMKLVVQREGNLLPEFEEICEVYVAYRSYKPQSIRQRIANKVKRLYRSDTVLLKEFVTAFNPDIIFANTAGVLAFASSLIFSPRVKLISYLHELEITFYYLSKEEFAEAAPQVAAFIMGSEAVRRYYETTFSVPPYKAHLIYDFIAEPREVAVDTISEIRNCYGIASHQKIVGGMASLIWRKGPDLFVEVARRVLAKNPDVYFLWIGGKPDSPMLLELQRDIRLLGLTERIIFAGEQMAIQGFYQAFDVFLLTSREDPFPLVCLEAAVAYTPIICFAEGGGMPEFVRDDAGSVVPYLDLDSMATRTNELLLNDSLRIKKASIAHERALQYHTIKIAGPQIAALLVD